MSSSASRREPKAAGLAVRDLDAPLGAAPDAAEPRHASELRALRIRLDAAEG